MTASRTTFGRYELVDQLGQGGFATVYRAWDPGLGREVALKALLPHLAADADIRRRFLAEGQALASLRHPNIVPVYDVGEAEGRPFFTMELIPGDTLASLAAGPQHAEQVGPWLTNLASALDYLHGAGLVHRDIKPANVLVEAGGRVVLMDLGIARAIDQTQYTATGTSLGTPAYMAPEQVRGDPVGPAADIYALGILAYQLYAGHVPFVGDTAYVLHAQAYEPPPSLDRVRPGLPSGVYGAIAMALAKDPAQRPASAGEFAAMLRGEAMYTTPSPNGWGYQPPAAAGFIASRQPSSSRRPLALLLVAGALVLALLLGGGAMMALHSSSSQPHSNTTDQLARPSSVAGNGGQQAISSAVVPPAAAATPSPAPASALATQTVLPTSAPTAPPAPPASPVVALDVTGFRAQGSDQWALGSGDLQGCFTYQSAPAGTALHIRVARSETPGTPLADGPQLALAAASGTSCAALPPAGRIGAGNYVAVLYDGAWQEHGRYAFNVQAPVTVAPPAPDTASAAATRTPPPPVVARNPIGRYAVVNSVDGVNVRPSPGATARTGCLAGGARVEITSGPSSAAGTDWYYVPDYGWISADFLQPGSPPINSDATVDGTARSFYEALGRHDLSAAWRLKSSRSQASFSGGYDSFLHGYDTTRAVIVNKITSGGGQVTVDYAYTDATAGGGLVASRRVTTWSMVQEGGSWRLDAVTSNQGLAVCS